MVPPNFSLASSSATDRPSRAAVYAPVMPPPDPATITSTISSKSPVPATISPKLLKSVSAMLSMVDDMAEVGRGMTQIGNRINFCLICNIRLLIFTGVGSPHGGG